MEYLVITEYYKEYNLCNVAFISQEPALELVNFATSIPIFNIKSLLEQGRVPLNFGVDNNGNVLQNSGDFSRFNKDGSYIVLAELASKAGVIKGYRLLSVPGLRTVNVPKLDLINFASKLRYPLLQNGIIRNCAVCCYPLHSFIRVSIKEAQTVRKNETPKTQARQTIAKKALPIYKSFSTEQLCEMDECKKRGIDTSLIENPDLSKQQMRVLWVSKSKGALSEYFSSPEFGVEEMKFYADRLYTKKIARECKPMLDLPKLTVPQLTELWQCVCKGIPFSDICNYDTTSTDMYLRRLERDKELWYKPEKSFGANTNYMDSLLDKAIISAMRLKEID